MSSQNAEKPSHAFIGFCKDQRDELIRLLRQTPAVLQITDQNFKQWSDSFRVVIPADQIKEIRLGVAAFGRSTEGGYSANIHNKQTGEIVGQVRLQRASPELLSSINQLAISASLAEINQRLESIEDRLEAITQGQIDDRFGELNSGLQLFVLACSVINPDIRRSLLVQAISQVSEARGRLIQSLETNIIGLQKELPTDKWKIIWKSISKDLPNEVLERASILEKDLHGIVQASCVMAMSLGLLDEPGSQIQSWQPLKDLVPRVEDAQRIIIRWLPGESNALPDCFSTSVSTAILVIEKGKLQEIGQVSNLEIDLMGSEIFQGDQT